MVRTGLPRQNLQVGQGSDDIEDFVTVQLAVDEIEVPDAEDGRKGDDGEQLAVESCFSADRHSF